MENFHQRSPLKAGGFGTSGPSSPDVAKTPQKHDWKTSETKSENIGEMSEKLRTNNKNIRKRPARCTYCMHATVLFLCGAFDSHNDAVSKIVYFRRLRPKAGKTRDIILLSKKS